MVCYIFRMLVWQIDNNLVAFNLMFLAFQICAYYKLQEIIKKRISTKLWKLYDKTELILTPIVEKMK